MSIDTDTLGGFLLPDGVDLTPLTQRCCQGKASPQIAALLRGDALVDIETLKVLRGVKDDPVADALDEANYQRFVAALKAWKAHR